MDSTSQTSLFEDYQALQRGHFQLSSGRHSDTYVQCARITENPRLANHMAQYLISKATIAVGEPDIILGPAYGGILWAYALAGKTPRAKAIFAERVDGKFTLRRGFDIQPGQKVYIAEDVVTTGKSTKEVINLVSQYEGNLLAVVAILNRGENLQFGVPLLSYANLPAASWPAEDCSLCRLGVPLHKPGSRPQGA